MSVYSAEDYPIGVTEIATLLDVKKATVSQWLQDASYSFFDNWYKSKQASLDNGGNGASLWDSNYVLTGLPLGSITKVGIAFHTTSATDLVTICGALIPACLFV